MILHICLPMKKKLVIGVFESDSINRFIYDRMVRLLPHEVDTHIFENSEEGKTQVQEINPDILFIDLHMHGEYLGGIEWLKTIKFMLPHTKFVATTALLQKNDCALAIDAGFEKCIEKPLPFHNLEQLLKESMN